MKAAQHTEAKFMEGVCLLFEHDDHPRGVNELIEHLHSHRDYIDFIVVKNFIINSVGSAIVYRFLFSTYN